MNTQRYMLVFLLSLTACQTSVVSETPIPDLSVLRLALQKSIDEVVQKTNRPREEIIKEFLKDAPGGKLVQPDQVAQKVAWFCEPEQSSVTGQAVVVEGE